MVDAVSSFDPIAYLKQINGLSAPASTDSSSPPTDPTPSNSSSANTTAATAPFSPDPSLLTSSPLALSPDILSLLQGSGSNASQSGSISSLLGGGISSSDSLAGVYAAMLYNDTQVLPYQMALETSQQTQTGSSTQTNSIQNIIDSYNNVLDAGNQTLLDNAQAVLAANDGTLPTTA
jgi:hypothetical protein